MKIKRITRNAFVKLSPSKFDEKLGIELSSWVPGKDVEVDGLNGVTVSSEAQLKTILKTIIPTGSQLVDAMHPEDNRTLKEDESRGLLDYRSYEEYNDLGPTEVYYSVELDLNDEPRREQVSLTLSSSVLKLLRRKTAKNGKSLSRCIDELLEQALRTKETDVRAAYEETLARFESLASESREQLRALHAAEPRRAARKITTARVNE